MELTRFKTLLESHLGDIKPLIKENMTPLLLKSLKSEKGRSWIKQTINTIISKSGMLKNKEIPMNNNTFKQTVEGYNFKVIVDLKTNSASINSLDENKCVISVSVSAKINYSSPDISGSLPQDAENAVNKFFPEKPTIKIESYLKEETPDPPNPYYGRNSLADDGSAKNIAYWLEKSNGGFFNDKEAWAEFAFNKIKDITVYNEVKKIMNKDPYKFLKSFMTTDALYNQGKGGETIDSKYKKIINSAKTNNSAKTKEKKSETVKGINQSQWVNGYVTVYCEYSVQEINNEQVINLIPKNFYLSTTPLYTPYGGSISINNNRIDFDFSGFAGLPAKIGKISFGKITDYTKNLISSIGSQKFKIPNIELTS